MSQHKMTKNSFRIVGQRFIIDLQLFCIKLYTARKALIYKINCINYLLKSSHYWI